MRPAALLAGAAGWALTGAIAAHALEAEDVAWGCEDAGFAQPLPGEDSAHRALVLLVHTDWGVLPASFELPEGQVYTGGAPVCADLDGDGAAEIVAAVRGQAGDWLTVYGKRTGPIASTRPVAGGLSLVGGRDLDGDGTREFAWVENAAGRLRVAQLREGALVEIATANGFAGRGPDGVSAVRLAGCSTADTDVVLPDAGGDALLRVRLSHGTLVSEPVAADALPDLQDCASAQHEETQ